MHCVLRSLIASAVLAHALVGCCAHDHSHVGSLPISGMMVSSHRCAAEQVDHPSGVHNSIADCIAQDKSYQQDSTPMIPHNLGRCDCQWLSGDDCTAGVDLDVALQWFCAVNVLVATDGSLAIDERATLPIHVPLALSVRAHLAMGVMLL